MTIDTGIMFCIIGANCHEHAPPDPEEPVAGPLVDPRDLL